MSPPSRTMPARPVPAPIPLVRRSAQSELPPPAALPKPSAPPVALQPRATQPPVPQPRAPLPRAVLPRAPEPQAATLPPLRPVPRRAPATPAVARHDDTLWDVADLRGRVLASRLNRAHIGARIQAGLLRGAALVRRSGEGDWRPLADTLAEDAVGIVRYWYVSRKGAGAVVGPVPSSLVEQGILTGNLPIDSVVCEVGDDYWSPLEVVESFRAAIDEAMFDDEVTSLAVELSED